MAYALFCEADSIQDWLMASGRLRDIVSGSDLLAEVWRSLTDSVTSSLGEAEAAQLRWARRAGGALLLMSDEPGVLDRFELLLAVAASAFVPGLTLTFGRGQGDDDIVAHEDAIACAVQRRNQPGPQLPVAPPHAGRDTRTGIAAVAPGDRGEFLDLTRARFAEIFREERIRQSRELRATGQFRNRGVASRFVPDGLDGPPVFFPTDLEGRPGDDADDDSAERPRFPFLGAHRAVAFVHGDGSGIGQIIQGFKNAIDKHSYCSAYAAFSQALDEATMDAARTATHQVLLPHATPGRIGGAAVRVLPARPIILGGDDLSIIVRADLALEFIQVFAHAFENATRQRLAGLTGGSVSHMSMGFGVVFAKASQPFSAMNTLAEQLCDRAKTIAKTTDSGNMPPPSVVGFHHQTSSLSDDWETLREEQLVARAGEHEIQLGLEAYALDPAATAGLPALDDLLALQCLLQERSASANGLRQLLTVLSRDIGASGRRYRRWREHTGRDSMGQDLCRRLDALIGRLVIAQDREIENFPAGLPTAAASSFSRKRLSPLGDLLTLHAVTAPAATYTKEEQTV